jgi:hypothetical protein
LCRGFYCISRTRHAVQGVKCSRAIFIVLVINHKKYLSGHWELRKHSQDKQCPFVSLRIVQPTTGRKNKFSGCRWRWRRSKQDRTFVRLFITGQNRQKRTSIEAKEIDKALKTSGPLTRRPANHWTAVAATLTHDDQNQAIQSERQMEGWDSPLFYWNAEPAVKCLNIFKYRRYRTGQGSIRSANLGG